MNIRKYDFNYGRRKLMENTALGLGAGVLMPLADVFAAEGDISKAYPEEHLSIEMYTKGKINTGDIIDASNVDLIKELFDPSIYDQIKNLGRKIKIRKTTTDFSKMFPKDFYELTLRNVGNGVTAKWDAQGNVRSPDGSPWVGGVPFPDPKTGEELQANLAMSWGRGNYCQYAINDAVFNNGKKAYDYEFVWAELQMSARPDGKILMGRDDLVRLQTVYFTSTQDVAGSSFLSVWYYDQSKFPDLYGYLPQFRRVRQFPTNQRFEPLIPGVTWFLSDPWGAGDPMRTWSEYKIIERKPMLGPFNTNFVGTDNWNTTTHGGESGEMFFDTEYELAPEVAVLESKPTGYPRAPVGHRHCYVDTRMSLAGSSIRYDRQGKMWVNFEAGYGQQIDPVNNIEIKGPDGKSTAWSWMYVLSYDHQNQRMSRARHLEECAGGWRSQLGGDDEEAYDTFFTQQALQRLGQV